MDAFKIFILGLIQGFTEFLPVSSSGHLCLGREFLGFSDAGLVLDVAFHFGTLFSILIFYRHDLFDYIREGIKEKPCLSHPFLLLFIGISPAGLAGVFLGDFFEKIFEKPILVPFFLFITGLSLLSLKLIPKNKTLKPMTVKSALIIGFCQVFALFPGISRAGSTIVSALHCGISRDEAAKFSFFMAIPLLFGATLLKFKDILALESISVPLVILGMITSCLSGIVAIQIVMKTLTHHRFHIFSWYLFSVSIISLIGLLV